MTASLSQRFVALAIAGLFLTSAASTAWTHCVGWGTSVADSHACCRKGAVASDARATACCAMSEQTGDAGPIEARVAAGPVKMARHGAPPAALAGPDARPAPHVPVPVPTSGSVPLYLRQSSLLI